MRTMTALVAGLALAVAVSGCSRKSGVAAAADAMGATNLNSIQFSGSGTNYAFGQAYTPGGPWPRFEVKNYIAAVDYQTPAMRLEMLRAQGEHPPRGRRRAAVRDRPADHSGRQREIRVERRRRAAGAESRRRDRPSAPDLADAARRRQSGRGERRPRRRQHVYLQGRGRDVKVTLNHQNLVERVEYLTTNSVVGDVPVEVTYSDYAKFGDIQFPRHIVEKQDGFPTLDIMITDVQPNAAVSLPVPANVASAPAPPATPMVTIEKVGDGLWSLNGAGTRSLAVEFADHIVMLEGPTSDARSKAANDLVRKTVPNKPITLRRQHARPLRSRGRPAGIRRRRHHRDHAREQQGVLRAGVGAAADRRGHGADVQQADDRNRRGQEGAERPDADRRAVFHERATSITPDS